MSSPVNPALIRDVSPELIQQLMAQYPNLWKTEGWGRLGAAMNINTQRRAQGLEPIDPSILRNLPNMYPMNPQSGQPGWTQQSNWNTAAQTPQAQSQMQQFNQNVLNSPEYQGLNIQNQNAGTSNWWERNAPPPGRGNQPFGAVPPAAAAQGTLNAFSGGSSGGSQPAAQPAQPQTTQPAQPPPAAPQAPQPYDYKAAAQRQAEQQAKRATYGVNR